jgi:hypothetical protein
MTTVEIKKNHVIPTNDYKKFIMLRRKPMIGSKAELTLANSRILDRSEVSNGSRSKRRCLVENNHRIFLRSQTSANDRIIVEKKTNRETSMIRDTSTRASFTLKIVNMTIIRGIKSRKMTESFWESTARHHRGGVNIIVLRGSPLRDDN